MAKLFTDEEIKARSREYRYPIRPLFTDAEIAERSKTFKYQLPEQYQTPSQQPAKGVTGTTTKVSATSTGKLPAAEPYQVPLPDAMISVSKGRNVASQLPMSPDEFVNAPDFSEKSLPNPVKNTAWHAGLFTPEYDKNYMYINDVNGARDKISREATIKSLDTATMFDDGTPSQVKKGYDYITGDEVKLYNYLYSSYG